MELNRVAKAIVSRAREQGYVRSLDIRDELKRNGEPARAGKTWCAGGPAAGAEERPLLLRLSAANADSQGTPQPSGGQAGGTALIRTYKAACVSVERRDHAAFTSSSPFASSARMGRNTTCSCRISHSAESASWATARLARAESTRARAQHRQGPGQWQFSVHFLWSATVGDNLVESGGIFLEVAEESNHGK